MAMPNGKKERGLSFIISDTGAHTGISQEAVHHIRVPLRCRQVQWCATSSVGHVGMDTGISQQTLHHG